MNNIGPIRRRMIEDMTVRDLSPAIQQFYVHAGAKFGRFFGHSPGAARPGGGACLSGASCCWWRTVAGSEPDRLRPSVPVWRDTEAGRLARADPVCPHARKLPAVRGAG